jgi:hypothetical protein
MRRLFVSHESFSYLAQIKVQKQSARTIFQSFMAFFFSFFFAAFQVSCSVNLIGFGWFIILNIIIGCLLNLTRYI